MNEVYIMAIDIKTVKKIAKLSRLKLADAQIDVIAKELSEVLVFVEQLDQVDTSSISPMDCVHPIDNLTRKDVVDDGNYAEKIISNSPAKKEGFFVVPKVVE